MYHTHNPVGAPEKVLFDTDIGTDIDDALSLAYLLMQPRCDLLGITTVTGEAEQRAMLASVMCRAAGRDIPIYVGAETPLLIPQREQRAAQADVLSRWAHTTRFPHGEAIEFLRQTIRRYPGEVTLLGVAPMTNIALLFSVDPEIPRLLKALYLMCGRFSSFASPPSGHRNTAFSPDQTDLITCNGALEMNALIDPHATALVYRAAVPLHRSIGIDITRRVTMSAEAFQQTFRHDLFAPIFDMARSWFTVEPLVTFHDPLATAAIFEPEICTYGRGRVRVELQSDTLGGYTYWDADPSGPHEIATDVISERFFAHYRSVFAS